MLDPANLGDRWAGDGCGFMQMVRHGVGYCRRGGDYPQVLRGALRRQAFLQRYVPELNTPGGDFYPFVHNCVEVEGFEWEGFPQHLDPLIIPLVLKMQSLPGVRTITSCQGAGNRSPYVFFAVQSLESLAGVQDMIRDWHRAINEGWYWNHVPIVFEQMREEGATFILQFYDPIALVKFTLEYLGVSLEEQMAIPHWPTVRRADQVPRVEADAWRPFMKMGNYDEEEGENGEKS